jgi:hypothetical protein
MTGINNYELRNGMNSNVLAEYYEKRFQGRRTFRLYPDKVNVRAKLFSVDADVNIELANVNPDYSRVWLRSPLFKAGQTSFLMSLLLIWLVRQLTNDSLYVGFAALAPVGSILLMVIARKKIEYTQFLNSSHKVVLDVAKSGPSANTYDEFVKAISDAAKLAKQNQQQSAPQ